VISLLVQPFVPVFADTSVAASSAAYQKAYSEYVNAVQSQAPQQEIEQKLDAYLAAKAAYQQQTGMDAGSANFSSTPAAAQTAETIDSSESIQVTQNDASDQVADAVSDAEHSKNIWQKFKEFNAKIVQNGLKLIGGTSAPGQMPLWEKIAWTIGKSLLPTMGVVVATALLAPLSPVAMIIGGIVTGAALAGTMTYAYEKRMNAKYREVKKEEAKIWRDVTVNAAVEAVMAPFNLATGGLFGMVGPTVGHAIGKVALSQAVITFAGRAVSSQVGGAVKNAWAKHYFKYPEKIEANEARIDEILNSRYASETPFSEEEIAELDRLRKEIDTMRGEMYSKEDAVKDLKRAGLAAAISGFAGSIISDRAYNSTFGRWADQASVKLFGSVAKGKAISSLVSTMPVNFGSGMAGASLEKSFIDSDIDRLRKEQSKHNKGSPIYEYYQRVIAEKTDKKDSINATKAGFDTMMNSFAVQAARLTVDAIKYNVYDGPKAKKAAVEALYREKNPEWQKANSLQKKYEDLKANAPNPLKYRSPVSFARAIASHKKIVDQARSEWLKQAEIAGHSDSSSANVALKAEVKSTYERDVKLNQMLELGRLRGGEAHLKAMKEVLKARNPELADASDEKLNAVAALAIKQTYIDKFESSSKKSANYQELLEKKRQYKAGKLELSPEEAKILTGKAAAISPSQYKAALVEKRVYELKSQNVRWSDVERKMPSILADAEKQMLSEYGNNWANVLVAEAYANGLAKYKYDPEGRVNFSGEMKKVVKSIPQMIKKNVLGEYTSQVNKAIISNVLPQDTSSDMLNYVNTFGKTAISDATSKTINTVYDVSSEKLTSSFFY
jgi:chitodextrinase